MNVRRGLPSRSYQRGFAVPNAVVRCTQSSRGEWTMCLGSRWANVGNPSASSRRGACIGELNARLAPSHYTSWRKCPSDGSQSEPCGELRG
jgi:hypothetical protein